MSRASTPQSQTSFEERMSNLRNAISNGTREPDQSISHQTPAWENSRLPEHSDMIQVPVPIKEIPVFIEVDKPYETIIEVPVEKVHYIDKPVKKIVEVRKEKVVERVRYVDKPIYIDKVVEKIVEVPTVVLREKVVERVVKVPIEKIVVKKVVKEVPVIVPRVVEVVKEVEVQKQVIREVLVKTPKEISAHFVEQKP